MTAQLDRHQLRWGFSTLGCPVLSLPEVCALAADFKMRDLEIRALGNRTDLPQYAAESGLAPATVRRLLEAFEGRIAVAGSDFKLIGGGESQRAAFLQFCQWAESLGVRYVRVFGGGATHQVPTKNDFADAAKNVVWWRAEKAKRNWRTEILLETHDAFVSSRACAELCARLDPPLGVIWDAHHTWRLAGESPEESWATLGPWVRHVHIKDSVDRPSARHPFTYVLPGQGQAPLGEIIALLRQKRFSGVVSLEWEKLWHPYLPDLSAALVQLQGQEWFDGSPHSASISSDPRAVQSRLSSPVDVIKPRTPTHEQPPSTL